MKKRKILIGYLVDRQRVFYAFLITNLMYFLIYVLYQMPKRTYLYGLLLNVFFCFILVIIDFSSFLKKYKELSYLHNSIEVRSIDIIKPSGCIEEQYHQLIQQLKEELSEVTLAYDEQRSNQEEYLTMWTHQIKTPVSALRLLTLNLPQSKERTEIEQELFRVEEYIGMVLQYQRADTMGSDLYLKEYDLYQLVKQAVKKYSIIFIRKHLSLELIEFHTHVITDEKWLVFVLEQIISNATKYTNQGGIRIYLQEEYQLVIEDTGIGIRKEDIKRVFERGYTGYNGRMDKKSTGIGMYLCKKILDQLGIKIRIESEVSVGTRVILDLTHEQLDFKD